jgi:AcrR family transcriptional regulator
MGGTTRPERGGATRDVILQTAERLFAERGLHAVSNRQVSEAAGQGNSAAVGYHFGTKADLVRAIVRRHTDQMEQARTDMISKAAGSSDVRTWVACLVRPLTDHLAAMGVPSWYARFFVQVASDPVLHEVMVEAALRSIPLRMLLVGLNQCLPDLPANVHTERWEMARHMLAQMCADRERSLAAGTPTLHASWSDLATSMVDAITGLWLAPCTRAA